LTSDQWLSPDRSLCGPPLDTPQSELEGDRQLSCRAPNGLQSAVHRLSATPLKLSESVGDGNHSHRRMDHLRSTTRTPELTVHQDPQLRADQNLDLIRSLQPHSRDCSPRIRLMQARLAASEFENTNHAICILLTSRYRVLFTM